MNDLPRLMRISEVAEALSVSKTKAYNMVAGGVIPCIRMNGSVRVPQAELQEWIKQNTTGGSSVKKE